jgi:hypothetical protein
MSFESLAPSISCWGAQLYRGRSFGGFLGEFEWRSTKALIVTEYGVDSYDDSACVQSWDDVCAAEVNPSQQALGEQMQAEWDLALAQELEAHSFRRGGGVIGGLVMAWADNWWKNTDANVKGCRKDGTCDFKGRFEPCLCLKPCGFV